MPLPDVIPSPLERDRIRAAGGHTNGRGSHTSFPRDLSPRKRGAGIHYEEDGGGQWQAPSCRWHSPGLGMIPCWGASSEPKRHAPAYDAFGDTLYCSAARAGVTRRYQTTLPVIRNSVDRFRSEERSVCRGGFPLSRE
jgi:hypothetical protein